MNFCSDNVTGAAPEILAAIVSANDGPAMPYGDDEVSARTAAKIAEIFETNVEVFLVATGTAANALALSAMVPPFGGVYCHENSHIHHHECGAPEFYSGGGKLYPLSGSDGKLAPADLETALAAASDDVHWVQPAAISISQTSESGTIYSATETAAIAKLAHDRGLKFHVDGARFANAVAALEVAPAELTWRAGVDVLSFGATKNGAIAAEAIVFFDRALAKEFGYRRKRGGHLFSKMRFVAAQFDAYLEAGRWRDWANHANQMAARLAAGLAAAPDIGLPLPVQSNLIFARLPVATADRLIEAGFQFYRESGEDPEIIRLVTAFNTREEDVDAFIKTALIE